MPTFTGRLFGPGLPGAGITTVACWRDGLLSVTVGGRDVSSAHLEISGGGFNAATLRLAWQDGEGAWVFCLDEEGALAACLATAPESLAVPLRKATGRRKSVERRFRLGWGVLVIVVLLPVFALIGAYLGRDRLAAWAVDHIPYEQEAQLGELALQQTRLTVKLVADGPAVEALRTIGAPLTSGSPHRYRWFVADDPAVNAFAAPGGVVVVNSGLLRAARSPEEVAGVLAHEIAHAELRHTLKMMVKGLGLRALVGLLLGDFSGSAMTEVASHLTELSFSREAEREADREGMRRLVAANIDPHGMLSFFETLDKEQKLVPPAFLSTHPDTAERLASLRQELAAMKGEWQPLKIDLSAVQAALPKP